MYVKTCVSKSSIDNLGLFAAEDIPKGHLIWKYHPSTCLTITPEQEHVLTTSHNDHLTASINHFGCSTERGCLIHMDNMRYINHSETPNTFNLDNDTMIAARDIKEGEELYEDYRGYSSNMYCVEFLQNMK